MKKIAVLGSTGSIGTQTLDVVRSHKDEFEVCAICAGKNALLALEQAKEFTPDLICMEDEAAALSIKELLPKGVELYAGKDAAAVAARYAAADTVVNAVSGFAGTLPLIAALEAGKRVALANKESIVCAHELVEQAKRKGGGEIIPVDSEQSAIFQCLCAGEKREVRRLILTASGGPFRQFTKEQLDLVTPQMACHHPTWSMGRKITIDSASLFNKGLEIMEAAYLFGMDAEKISVLVHPQSVVHSMVEYCDSAVIAQLSAPDMRLAIHYALTYPKRHESSFGALDLTKLGMLTFEEPDTERFRAIPLAYRALEAGGIMPAVYNGANEAAVDMFIKGMIRFTDIADHVERAMDSIANAAVGSFEELLEYDAMARMAAVKG